MEPRTDNLTTKCSVALLTSNAYFSICTDIPNRFLLTSEKAKVELFGRKKEWFAAQEAHFKRYVTSSGNMDTKKEKQEDEN